MLPSPNFFLGLESQPDESEPLDAPLPVAHTRGYLEELAANYVIEGSVDYVTREYGGVSDPYGQTAGAFEIGLFQDRVVGVILLDRVEIPAVVIPPPPAPEIETCPHTSFITERCYDPPPYVDPDTGEVIEPENPPIFEFGTLIKEDHYRVEAILIGAELAVDVQPELQAFDEFTDSSDIVAGLLQDFDVDALVGWADDAYADSGQIIDADISGEYVVTPLDTYRDTLSMVSAVIDNMLAELEATTSEDRYTDSASLQSGVFSGTFINRADDSYRTIATLMEADFEGEYEVFPLDSLAGTFSIESATLVSLLDEIAHEQLGDEYTDSGALQTFALTGTFIQGANDDRYKDTVAIDSATLVSIVALITNDAKDDRYRATAEIRPSSLYQVANTLPADDKWKTTPTLRSVNLVVETSLPFASTVTVSP